MFEDINDELNIFCKRLNSITSYIDLVENEKKLSKLFNQSEEIRNNKELSEVINLINENINSQVVYNAIIISLYSCYENYIDNILTKYLENLSNLNILYSNLPKAIQDNHTRLSGEFLSNLNRYKNYYLNPIDVVNNLSNCLNTNDKYILNKKILIMHPGNLGIEALNGLFSQVGIDNLLLKIKVNKYYKQYYKQENDIEGDEALNRIISSLNFTLAFQCLQDLVNRRNVIAHSWNEDERLNMEIIKEKYIIFFIMIGKAIHSILATELYSILYKNDKLVKFEVVHKVIDNRIVCLNNGNIKIKKGDYIFIKRGNDKYSVSKILNMEINKEKVEKCEDRNRDIGIELDDNINIRNQFFMYVNM